MLDIGFRNRSNFSNFSDTLHLPPLRNPAEGGIDEAGVLVAGEAELDEPLAVEVLRHLLQNLDPPQVVLDQVVVGRENRRDFPLRGERGTAIFEGFRSILMSST